MKSNKVTSITYYGNVSDEPIMWIDWYKFTVNLLEKIGSQANYISINSNTHGKGGILKRERNEEKIINLIKSGESINWLSIYALPQKFSSASFDYIALSVRARDFLTLILDHTIYEEKITEEIIDSVKNYIDVDSGEIYTMDRHEMPLLFATRANPPTSFKSLNIIRNI